MGSAGLADGAARCKSVKSLRQVCALAGEARQISFKLATGYM